ncbi:MAG: beta strand repeat-containing protein, partial [Frankiaceae bacterium]
MNGYALIALISRLRRSIAVVAVLAVIASIGGVLGLTSSASAAAVAFSNSTAISIADAGVCSPIPCTPTPGTGTPYPSNIAVSGVAGTIASLTVVLHNVTHPATNDIDVLLVGPGGQKFVLVSDAGGGCPTCTASNASVTFDDAAASTLGTTGGWPTGTFRPSNEGTSADGFPSPAPAAPYSSPAPTGSATLGTTFNGTDPNGTWSLYAVDDLNGGTGSFAGGWTLNITPASAAPTTTSVTSSTNPSRTGNSVTLSAHVIRQSDSSNVTTSTVTFKEGSTTLASNVALSASGIAAFSTASLTEGSHVITAFYNGDATFAQSNGSVTQVVDNNTTVSAGSYCNTGVLTLNDSLVSATATPYPSHVFVSSLAGAISKVTLTAKGVTEPFASDLDLLLVGPSGQKFVIVSDAGGPVAISNATVTFDDDAVSQFVQASGGWSSGSTRPVDYNTGTDTFPSPAPASPLSPVPTGTATLASVFGGIDPNGTWSLYAVDDSLSSGSGGSIANGWCLNFTTSNDPATTTTVTSSTNPSSAGSSVTFAAHVTKTSDSSNVTTGTVTFRSDGIVIGAPTALSGAGTASTTTSALSEGTHTITASYSGSPGNFNLSTGSMSQQVDSSTVVSGTTYCNNGGIQVNDPASNGVIGTATPYPSHIVVSGTSGNLLKLTATIKGITHTSPDDLDILLVSPTGTTLKLMSDTGGLTAISGVNLTLDDAAASSLPDSTAISAGTFKPTDYVAGDTFPSPAPAGPYGSPAPVGAATLASFAGGSPNGTWSLYVADDGLGDPGSVSGWCLNLTLPPVANDDAYNAAQDTTLTVPAPGVLANDTGTPAPTAVAIAGGPTTQGGTVTLSTNGGFTYAPPSGFTGTDTFTYTATNGPGATDTATVTITVTHKPAITGATVARQQGSPAANDTIATVSDVETPNGNLTVTASPPAGISVSNITNTAGTVTADVAATCAATTGPNSVPLTVTDGDSLTNTANLTVNVSANTAPTLAYGASGLAVNAGGTGAVDPSSGPSDNGSIASLTVQNVPAAFTGTVTIDGPASATPGRVHIGTAGPAGDYTITLRTTDNCGLVTDASLALTVNGAPTVDAGSAQTVGIATGATLAGSVTDDGRAPGNSTPTALWSKDSGPGTVTFADASSPTTHADFSVAGVYVLRLTGDDGQLTSSDTVQITVGSAPVIHVPADITVTEASPGAGSAVSFTVTADGFPTPTIACAEGATPVSSGSTFAAGVHTIDCTATNVGGSDSGSFTITVRSVPVITVPADITVTETTPGAGASVPFTVTATGTPTPTIACAEGATPVSSGSTFAAGVHTIDCTATNAVGSDSGSFTITVRSVPVITVPADITVTETTPGAGASVPFTVTATGT